MFELDYRMVCSEHDDFVGQNGFFQIKCNGYIYGKMYSEEIENIMDKVSFYDWFERMVKVVKNLAVKRLGEGMREQSNQASPVVYFMADDELCQEFMCQETVTEIEPESGCAGGKYR